MSLALRATLLCFLAAARCAASEVPEPFAGRVVGVKDGDTIEILEGRVGRVVRLWGIDCPERGQPYGARAKQTTSDLCHGKVVDVEPKAVDRWGRVVARVRLPGGRDLSSEIVRAGMAWWFVRYAPRDDALARLEREARDARRGLWSDPHPVPPWVFRRNARRGRPRSAHAG